MVPNVRPATYLIAAGIWAWPSACAQQQAVATFGVTVVAPGGLVGVVYYIPPSSQFLPDFQQLHPVGVIYTSSLNVGPRAFTEGFPGLTDRYEWFAIDYTGRFWIDRSAVYQFALTSDDGAKLYIDDRLVVNNDGVHPPEVKAAFVRLGGGVHRIRVSYFQGPRQDVALILQVAGPGEKLRTFSTDEFKPPTDPAAWTIPDADQPPDIRAMGKRVLRISPAAGSPGDDLRLELSFDPPLGQDLLALQWQMAVPVQILDLVGEGPEIGSAAADVGKLVRCSTAKSYLYTCLLVGGRQPIKSGPIAVFHFKIRPGVQPKTTVVRIEKVQAVTLEGEFDLSSVEGVISIR